MWLWLASDSQSSTYLCLPSMGLKVHQSCMEMLTFFKALMKHFIFIWMKFLFKNLNVLLSTVTLLISALRKYKLEVQESEVTLSYIGSLRPVWATRDLISRVFFKPYSVFFKKGIKI